MTIDDLAKEQLPGETYDLALPIDWCDQMKALTGKWPVGFVWHYPKSGPGHIWGTPFPLTPEAIEQLALATDKEANS